VGGLDVLVIVGIDQDADANKGVARSDLIPGQGADRGAIVDLGRVLVFVDHLHRQEALARIGQGDRHRTGIEVEHRRRIERIAVHPDNRLPGDRRRLAAMHELAKAAVLDHAAEIKIRLGADEIVGGYGDRLVGKRRLRAAERAQHERHEQGQTGRVHVCIGPSRGRYRPKPWPGLAANSGFGPFLGTRAMASRSQPR
jgi:hypothetical protein